MPRLCAADRDEESLWGSGLLRSIPRYARDDCEGVNELPLCAKRRLADATDAGAHARKLFFDPFVAPVKVIYAVDCGFALRYQTRQNQ